MHRFNMILVVALLSLVGGARSQVSSFKENFLFGGTGGFGWWSTPPGSKATSTEQQGWASPNGHWKKVLWEWSWPGAASTGPKTCRLLPERVAGDKKNVLLLSVPSVYFTKPISTKGEGGEIVSTRLSKYGAYRINMSVSTTTADFNTGACNSLMVRVPGQGEIEICLYSRVQGIIGYKKGIVECFLRKFDSSNKTVATWRKSLILDFDPRNAKHTYGFDWHTGWVEFVVDNKALPGTKVLSSDFSLPSKAGNIRIKHWTGDIKGCGRVPRHYGQTVNTLYMVVDWVEYKDRQLLKGFYRRGRAGSHAIGWAWWGGNR